MYDKEELMETEIKMLSDIHKNADMGQDTLRHILDATKGCGNFRKRSAGRCRNMKKHFRSVDRC